MRVVVQRVTKAHVKIEGTVRAAINVGYLILLGIEHEDTGEDIAWLCRKISALRVFSDAGGNMNLPITDVDGEVLVISQFTLHASTKKGNRPSFIRAARPETAIPLYKAFVSQLEASIEKKVMTGEFGAYMEVSLTNDGPVTIIMDSKLRE